MKTLILKVYMSDSFPIDDITDKVVELTALSDDGCYHRRTANVEIIPRPSNECGVAGCTYGDTDYDSKSVAYGYNLALNQIFGEDGE